MSLVTIAGSILLLLLVLVTYHDAPQNGFHLDDGRNIHRYPPVMVNELTIDNVIDAGRNAMLPTRPLPSVTFAIDWARGGGSARPFQWTNIAIHSVTAILIFALLISVLGRLNYLPWVKYWGALIGAALWACHPIQVQAVTYIVQRMASMATLFTILTVLFYILGRGKSGWRSLAFFALAGASWLLGMASKETAAIAPFLCLLAEYGVIRHGHTLVRTGWDRLLLALPVIAGMLIAVDIWSGAGPLSAAFLPVYDGRDFTLGERLLTQPRVILFHLSQIIWPMPGRFSLEHDFPVSSGLFSPATTIAALAVAVAWCVVGIWTLFQRHWRVIGFFLLWVPATLVIESSFVALEMVFEHRMYMASIGLVGLAAILVSWMLRRFPVFVPYLAASCAIVIIFLMISTTRYIPVWENDVTLSANSVSHAPNSGRAWLTYAIALRDKREGWNTIGPLLQRSIELDPNSAKAWSTYAMALRDKGEGWEAVGPPLSRALEIDPNELTARNLRAIQFIENRRLEEAEQILESVSGAALFDYSILNTMGMLRFEQGNIREAVQYFERAVNLNQSEPVFIYNLALSYELIGRCNDARRFWLTYLQLVPDGRLAMAVEERLNANFARSGGRCFGVTQ
jgi:Flp pilus assembly protein TadD